MELEELSANPLHKVKFRKAKVSGEIDRRSVVNPSQARELLTAVTYVGRFRGAMLRALVLTEDGHQLGWDRHDAGRLHVPVLQPARTARRGARRPAVAYEDRRGPLGPRWLPGRTTCGTRPSLWLNAGVHAPEAAERAGHGVDVLFKVYAKCIDGQREAANKRITEALTE
ncbi:hypothetical protein [Nonomuraea maritima]|uniref:hypothetical protein n=1 Tax=Nonomuraea maritima TaxID=683260 RepID=UPI001C40918B|nr:hypothetical protein [Nonomuraea maritima]